MPIPSCAASLGDQAPAAMTTLSASYVSLRQRTRGESPARFSSRMTSSPTTAPPAAAKAPTTFLVSSIGLRTNRSSGLWNPQVTDSGTAGSMSRI